MTLTPIQQRFVLHWGEMGSRWGISRTVAQIHALLYLSPAPLDAEEIADTLSVARSNVSTSIKELLGWGIVKTVHVLGDRRDHFEAMSDVWEMFRIIVDERKRRETDPTLSLLREITRDPSLQTKAELHTKQRLESMLSFFELMSTWCDQTRRIPTPVVVRLLKMGDKIAKLARLG